MYNHNRDLIYFIKREGTAQNPYNNITENIHVLYEKAFLEEVPVQSFKVVAKVGNITLTEVARQEDIRTTNQYYVNYKQGIVYFHSSKNSVLVTLTYKGQGVLLYPASRIYIDSEVGAGNVVKTLKDLIKEGENALNAVQDVSSIINRAETLFSQIETSVIDSNNAIRLINEKISEFSTAESSRVSAENTRRTSESARVSAEIARANAETTRANSETIRVNAEIIRVNSENARISKEAERQAKETDRVSKETARVSAETERQTRETARINAETSRANAESVRNTRENERVANENNRIANENIRLSNEADRVSKELLRQSQESQRQTSFQTAIENVDIARANAESATDYTISIAEDALRVTLNAEELINDTGFKGEFEASKLYSRNNIISYNGSSYIAVQDTIGNLPTNRVYWGELSKKGTDGIGSVASVNNASPDLDGNVMITAEDIGAERASRKGVANGYAGLNASGKVVDASGNEVAGKVTSVNGAIGDVTGLETTASVDAKFTDHIENDILKHVEILSTRPRTLDKRGILFVVKSIREDIPELIDGGSFGEPYDEELIDGGSFGEPYDEVPIDGGIFKPVENIDSGLFTSLDDNTPIDEGLFTSLDDNNPIDGGTF